MTGTTPLKIEEPPIVSTQEGITLPMLNFNEQINSVRGTNYVPSTSVNNCQFWEEYDQATIDRELGYAEELGLNSIRVFLQYLVFEDQPELAVTRFDAFCSTAQRHGLSVLPVLFDDCFGPEPELGPYPEPTPGVHNSMWRRSPGISRMALSCRAQLRRYVEAYVGAFRDDARVLAWEIYNEPSSEPPTMALMNDAFDWVRQLSPAQPLTACWSGTYLSDIVNLHLYTSPSRQPDELGRIVESTESFRKPVLVTEFLGRPHKGTLKETLPLFAERGWGWYFWELMIGKTQVDLPWSQDVAEHPDGVAYQGLLYPDGRAYDAAEIELIKTYTGAPFAVTQ